MFRDRDWRWIPGFSRSLRLRGGGLPDREAFQERRLYQHLHYLCSGENILDQTAYHRSCVVRNCLVDGEYLDNPVAIASITFEDSTATALTKTPHGRRTGDWVVVTGALVADSEDNPFNGSYRMMVVDSHRFQYTLLVPPDAEPTGEMWIGKTSSHFIGIKRNSTDPDPYNPGEQGVSVEETGEDEWTVTVITEKPLKLNVVGAVYTQKDMDRLPAVLKEFNPDAEFDIHVELIRRN